jgi:hypothetical protein
MIIPKSAKAGPKPRKPLQRRTALRPCRPGKKPKAKRARSTPPPTPAQVARWDRMREIGCICCLQINAISWGQLEIHHRQKRLGHDETICLCAWHHRGVLQPGWTLSQMEWTYDASLARASKSFRRTFGLDEQLLALQNSLLEQRS